MDKTIYLVTGAAGHLGGTIVRALCARGAAVRALALEGDPAAQALPPAVALCYGDITDRGSLYRFFDAAGYDRRIVIHAAGIVSIASKMDRRVYDVNVNGTVNIVDLCVETAVDKLVYVSSVHAIPERPKGETMTEVDRFDPALVTGLYAKTKAEATRYVLEAAARGLDASVVHPSGICGPFDHGRGHITQLLIDYCSGALRVGVRGGFDFVDVRDVADGILACCEKGARGACYILSNRYFSVRALLDLFSRVTGYPPVRRMLPMWFAKATAGPAELYYKLRKQPPLFTAYSMHTLSGNALYAHDKAARELGYTVRPFEQTVGDAVRWLTEQGRIHPRHTRPSRTGRMTLKRRRQVENAQSQS